MLRIYLDDLHLRAVEVSVQKYATFADVVEKCKTPGDTRPYHVVELWRGYERVIKSDDSPMKVYSRWGPCYEEVRFYLRHFNPPHVDSLGERHRRRETGKQFPTTEQLEATVQDQLQRIANQQRLLVAKEQRLQYLQQQQHGSVQLNGYNSVQLRRGAAQSRVNSSSGAALGLQLDTSDSPRQGPQLSVSSLQRHNNKQSPFANHSLDRKLTAGSYRDVDDDQRHDHSTSIAGLRQLFETRISDLTADTATLERHLDWSQKELYTRQQEIAAAMLKVEAMLTELDRFNNNNNNNNNNSDSSDTQSRNEILLTLLKQELKLQRQQNVRQEMMLTAQRDKLSTQQGDLNVVDQQIAQLMAVMRAQQSQPRVNNSSSSSSHNKNVPRQPNEASVPQELQNQRQTVGVLSKTVTAVEGAEQRRWPWHPVTTTTASNQQTEEDSMGRSGIPRVHSVGSIGHLSEPNNVGSFSFHNNSCSSSRAIDYDLIPSVDSPSDHRRDDSLKGRSRVRGRSVPATLQRAAADSSSSDGGGEGRRSTPRPEDRTASVSQRQQFDNYNNSVGSLNRCMYASKSVIASTYLNRRAPVIVYDDGPGFPTSQGHVVPSRDPNRRALQANDDVPHGGDCGERSPRHHEPPVDGDVMQQRRRRVPLSSDSSFRSQDNYEPRVGNDPLPESAAGLDHESAAAAGSNRPPIELSASSLSSSADEQCHAVAPSAGYSSTSRSVVNDSVSMTSASLNSRLRLVNSLIYNSTTTAAERNASSARQRAVDILKPFSGSRPSRLSDNTTSSTIDRATLPYTQVGGVNSLDRRGFVSSARSRSSVVSTPSVALPRSSESLKNPSFVRTGPAAVSVSAESGVVVTSATSLTVTDRMLHDTVLTACSGDGETTQIVVARSLNSEVVPEAESSCATSIGVVELAEPKPMLPVQLKVITPEAAEELHEAWTASSAVTPVQPLDAVALQQCDTDISSEKTSAEMNSPSTATISLRPRVRSSPVAMSPAASDSVPEVQQRNVVSLIAHFDGDKTSSESKPRDNMVSGVPVVLSSVCIDDAVSERERQPTAAAVISPSSDTSLAAVEPPKVADDVDSVASSSLRDLLKLADEANDDASSIAADDFVPDVDGEVSLDASSAIDVEPAVLYSRSPRPNRRRVSCDNSSSSSSAGRCSTLPSFNTKSLNTAKTVECRQPCDDRTDDVNVDVIGQSKVVTLNEEQSDQNVLVALHVDLQQQQHTSEEDSLATVFSDDSNVEEMPLEGEPEPHPVVALMPTPRRSTSISGSNSERHVTFSPLALLLDASLEGELDLVISTAISMENPSAGNEEGITALHNAVCAGHLNVVQFLVDFGCDVNAVDTDGWTPLHCAASCNNRTIAGLLLDNGATLFARTISDGETPADKCELNDEESTDTSCLKYLQDIHETFGIVDGGLVYAAYDYEAANADELSFKIGEKLFILRKGDENEQNWWWSSLNEKQGYVPISYLAMKPRVPPKWQQGLKST